MASGDLHLRLHGDPVRPADIRWAMPNLPENGSGKLDFGLDWTGKKSVYIARNMDVTLEGSHIAGQIEATVTDTIAYRDANLRFANLDTRLLTRLFPAMTFPRPLTLTGRAEFAGGNHSLRINGDVIVDDRLSGRSRLVGNGVMGLSNGIFTARGLRVRMQPLQMGLVESDCSSGEIEWRTVRQRDRQRLDSLHHNSAGRCHACGARSGLERHWPLRDACARPALVRRRCTHASARAGDAGTIHAERGLARHRQRPGPPDRVDQQSRHQHAAHVSRWRLLDLPTLTVTCNLGDRLPDPGRGTAVQGARHCDARDGRASAQGAMKPLDLSAGEQQRVAIARALVNDPRSCWRTSRRATSTR